MGSWGEYAAAWVIFLLTHVVPLRSPVKSWLVARLGRAGFGLAYSAMSVIVLVWLIGAAARAPFVELSPRAPWQNRVTVTAMALACLILVLATGRPNPSSLGGWRNDRFDLRRPGIVGVLRHPVLSALMLWSFGHLAPNGDLAHGLMFGGFAVFAGLGMVTIDRRRQREMGVKAWHDRLPARTLRGAGNPLRGLAAAFVLWGLISLHPLIIGLPVTW